MLNRRPRRQMNQMNVVPYIDVMLVLLVIFMVTAPMFTPGVIQVPSVSQAASLDQPPLEVVLDADGTVRIKDGDKLLSADGGDKDALAHQVASQLAGADRPVAISADENLKYADVVHVADALHKAGIKRVALTVKQQNNK